MSRFVSLIVFLATYLASGADLNLRGAHTVVKIAMLCWRIVGVADAVQVTTLAILECGVGTLMTFFLVLR